jgi:PTH1 family peptidyl-tRNA hydrolase
MKLVVWLWNPWLKYNKTRHNVWFSFIDKWVDINGLWMWRFESKYKADIIFADYKWEKLVLCKPQTYMNLSWEAVAPVARFYKISSNDILVLHDEIDFVTWRIALKYWWSSAGHNGLKSIIEKLGTRDFWRLRIWVDRPVNSSDVVDWVLSSFKPEEKKILVEKEGEIFNYIEDFLVKKV